MNRTRSAILLLLASLIVSGPLVAETLTVYGLKGPSGLGMVRMFERPPKVEGSDIKIEALPTVDLMVARLVSGEAKIGILPPNIAAKLYASGRPLAIAAVVGKGMLSLISSDASIRSLADLRGKEIYMAGQGATPDFVFRKILTASGINPERDISLRYSMAYPEMAQSLIAGRITHAVLPEPFATMALMGKPSLRVPFDLQKEWSLSGGSPDYPMTVLVVDTRFATEKGVLLKVILAAYQESIAWTVANPELAGVLAEKYELGLKAPIAAASIPKSAYVFTPAEDARGDLEALLRVFLALAPSSIGGKLPDDSFYYSSE